MARPIASLAGDVAGTTWQKRLASSIQEDRQLHGSILGGFAQQGECQQLSFPDPCEASAKNWSCAKPLVPGYGLPTGQLA
jgi:hypothetical protein